MNTRRACRVTCVWVFALFGLPALIVEASAESDGNDWQLSVPLYLKGGAFFQQKGDARATYQALVANLEFALSSPIRPYSVGLFVNQRFSPDNRFDGAVNLGGLFRYKATQWDTSTYVFKSESRGGPGLWVFGEQVRYRFADRHKLGIEAFGPFRDPGETTLLLGYYGTISRTVSVKIVAGANINAGQDRVALAELVWQIN